MKTMITDDLMSSTEHPHTAKRVAVGQWEVSWIPGRTFTRDQATTATVVVDLLITLGTTDPARLGRTNLGFLGHWSEELGLITSEMLTLFDNATMR